MVLGIIVDTELVAIKLDKIMQSKAYTCIVLGTDEKKFAIYTDLGSGQAMQKFLTESENPRPLTHDLINMIFRGYDIKIRQIVINDLQDTVYFARIYLEQKMGDILHILEIDARPSDCIALAITHKPPLYCAREVFEKTVPLIEEWSST